jgi:hypothetical protein
MPKCFVPDRQVTWLEERFGWANARLDHSRWTEVLSDTNTDAVFSYLNRRVCYVSIPTRHECSFLGLWLSLR